jgi:hypothetical protein
MLLAFGAGVLIAVSVLATVYLLRQPAASVVAQAPAAPSPASTAAPALSLSNGPIAPEKPAFAPVINAPAPALSPSNGPAPAENFAPAPAPALEKFPTPPTTAPAMAVTRPAPPAMPVFRGFSEGGSLPALSSSSGLDPSKPDPKILAYLDAMQVAGVRLSDTGSKVLMNDRVFRQGEIVDHLLGLRLIKVGSDMLTFVDERGIIYTKSL